ncbi:GTPase domain-containing protein [uncultured Acidaminococcus sp.]|uniref:GTPase n=1 Tax=uncultured Acidaminococcus sp. TaxID=352152 RepID=UPI00261E5E41|nr:GTPase domain-containing protein [uncultured Acidaminococcus sp.]
MAGDTKAIVAQFLQAWQRERDHKIKICLFGQPGAGKSSLINELAGQRVAKVSQATDTTRQAQIVECPDVIYVDLPGYDTSAFPENAYFSAFNPLQYDLFLCVFAGKLHQADVDFFGKIARTGRVCLFVRNKCDGLYDPSCSREELERRILQDVHSLVGPREKVVFTSCRRNKPAAERGLPELEIAMGMLLPEARRDRFFRHAKAYTEEALLVKRNSAERSLKKFMVLAAANGLNPVIGMDAALDSQILKSLYRSIREAFGVNEKEVQPEGPSSQIVKKLAEGVTGERVTKGLTWLLRKKASGKAAKAIPVVGGAAVMGFNAGSLYFLGQKYIDACYRYARERLQAEIQMGEP